MRSRTVIVTISPPADYRRPLGKGDPLPLRQPIACAGWSETNAFVAWVRDILPGAICDLEVR